MRIIITMKNPDCVSDAVDRAAIESAEEVGGISSEEREELIESRKEEVNLALEKWVKYGEYITVEIDTVLNTATVLRC